MEPRPGHVPNEQHKEKLAIQVVLATLPDQIHQFRKIYADQLNPTISLDRVCAQITERLMMAIQDLDRSKLAPVAFKHFNSRMRDAKYFLSTVDESVVVDVVVGEFGAEFQSLVHRLKSGQTHSQFVERHRRNSDVDIYTMNVTAELRGNMFVIGPTINQVRQASHSGIPIMPDNTYDTSYGKIFPEEVQSVLGIRPGDPYPITKQTKTLGDHTLIIGYDIIRPFDW